MTINNNSENKNELESLISGLRSEDRRNEKMTRWVQWIYWALLLFFLFILIFNPGGEHTVLDRLSIGCYIIGIASFAFVLRAYSKEYKNINYAIATIEMLKKAAARYKLFHKRLLYIIAPVLVMGIGMSLRSISLDENLIRNLLLSQAEFWGIIILSFSLGVILWYKRSKPLRDHALALIKEIEA